MDILSDLIWVQTVYKGYQQMAKVAASKERVKNQIMLYISCESSAGRRFVCNISIIFHKNEIYHYLISAVVVLGALRVNCVQVYYIDILKF